MIQLGSVVLLLATSKAVLGGVTGYRYDRRGVNPANPHDDNTTQHCSWWLDYNEETPCDQILQDSSITLEQFRRWNPSVRAACDNLVIGRSYCVEATFEPTPTGSPTGPPMTGPPMTGSPMTGSPTKPSTEPPSPTGTSAIETPLPTQPKIAPNCDAFYLVQQGDSCGSIADAHGITVTQFVAWNPSAGNTCSGLWADAYACVSIVGHEPSNPSSVTPQPTSTKPSNGIETPHPTQPRIVDNCNKFHLVESGQSCAEIASLYGITVAQFSQWNPAAGSNCAGLWADVYACVSIIGYQPKPTTTKPTTTKPTTTKPSNGINTPTPTQPSMVNNCNKFYLVKSGDSCATISSKHGITVADFTKWNPKAGSNCAGLWADAYSCVSVIGYTPPKPSTTAKPPPTTTKPGNGIRTPTPTQAGMVKNCNKFHLVKSGQTCATIQPLYKVTLANLVKWNPAIKADCTGLWADTHLCVGTL